MTIRFSVDAIKFLAILLAGWAGFLHQPFAGGAAHAQTTPFYQGKTIRIVVGFTAGSLYDQYARIFAQHMPKHIPGNPEMIVQNMPGAGSLIAANSVYGVAKPDGLTLGMVGYGVYLDQLLGNKDVHYDVRKFAWIGAVDPMDFVLYMKADTPWKSIEDFFAATEAPRCGATGSVDPTSIVVNAMQETLGTKVRIVRGYAGGPEIDLAIEKGEVHCRATAISAHFVREPYLTWHRQGFDRHIIQTGAKRDARMADTPTIYELMDKKKTPDISRGVARVLLASGTVGRPMLATPGIPAERIRILREAYVKALKEPELVAEAKKKRLELDFLNGEELEGLMREVSDQPRDVVDRVKKMIE